MHVTLVEINVHEDKVDEFIEVFRQNHLGSVQEEGNLRFDVLQDPEVNSDKRYDAKSGCRQRELACRQCARSLPEPLKYR